jgi:hypothetical protein
MSTTALGTEAMKITKPGITLVDVLEPEAKTYAVPATGELRLIVPPQRAMILVPQDSSSARGSFRRPASRARP